MRTFEQFLEHIKTLDFLPETILDVGVSYGTPEIYEAFPDAYYHLFEPLSELEDRLKLLCQKMRGEYYLLALSDCQGEASFHVPNQHDQSTLRYGEVTESENLRKVKTETLDNVFKERVLKGPVLIKTDCQGGDLDVIRGGLSLLDRLDMLIMEVQFFNTAGKHVQNTFGNVVSYMYERNFVVYDFIHYKVRPRDSALGQVNVVFVKEDSILRKHHTWS